MASGGATTAPKANATGKLTGRISHVIRPTPKAVTMTSNTDNCAMERRFARKSMTEVRMAAAYSSGGRKPTNTTSDDSSETCIRGRKDTPIPTSINSSGAEKLIRLASAVTARTVASRARMLRANSTAPCFHPNPIGGANGVSGSDL